LSFFNSVLCKTEEAARIFVKVTLVYPSKTFSGCSHRQKIALFERIFNQPCRDLQLECDLNAALNILVVGSDGLGLS
jgi:transposase